MRKRGELIMDDPSAGDRRVTDICLTIITSKLKSSNPSEMFSAGVTEGRSNITAFISLWDLG
jgi:hypothetical protein